MKDARQRLEQRRDELERLHDRYRFLHGSGGFGIFESSVRLHEQGWAFVNRQVPIFPEKDSAVPVEKKDTWIEVFPERSHCLRWWGKEMAIEEFREWADDTYSALWQFSPALHDDLSVGKGRFGTLWTLCSLASRKSTARSVRNALVRRPVVLAASQVKKAMPFALRGSGQPLVVALLDVCEDGVTFALRALSNLLGKSSKSSSQEPVLSQREYDFLEALYLLEATSPFDRRSTKEVAERSEGGSVNPERFKETVASLVRLGLVSTKEAEAAVAG